MLYFEPVGKASHKKKKVVKTSESGRAKLQEQISPASKAFPLSLIIIATSVAIVTFIVFLPVLQNEFVNWDDNVYVYENTFIRSIDATLFKTAFGEFHQGHWHPLTWISHAMDYAIWGLNPLGHHLTNIILHALNTFMVVFLVIRLMEIFRKNATGNTVSGPLSNDRTILITGAATGLLFGLHPLHVESVAWVTERKDLLCALFFLLGITMYTRYVSVLDNGTTREGSVSRFFTKQYLFTIGFFILSLLSKPMAVSFPFVLLILDWFPFNRIRSLKTFGTAFLEKLPFIALSLVSSILTLFANRAVKGTEMMEVTTLSTRLLVAAKSLVAYLWKMVLPINLTPFYPYPKNVSFLSLAYLLPVVVLIGITTYCAVSARKQKLQLSVWAYYVVTLLPVIGIIQSGSQSMADRYTYLPSLGPFLVIGLITATIYEKTTTLKKWGLISQIASVAVAITALISLSYMTIQQIGVWKNSLVFWNYVTEKEPGRFPVAYNNLGNAYQSKGLFDKAIEQYQIALNVDPDFFRAHYNLGNAYKSKGLFDKAIEQYQIVLSMKPDYTEAYNNLATIYLDKGLLDKAIELYQTVLRLKPNYVRAHYNLGLAYQSKDLLDKAIEQYQIALSMKPDYAEAHRNLGFVYIRKGLKNEAIRELKTALDINPETPDVRQALEALGR